MTNIFVNFSASLLIPERNKMDFSGKKILTSSQLNGLLFKLEIKFILKNLPIPLLHFDRKDHFSYKV